MKREHWEHRLRPAKRGNFVPRLPARTEWMLEHETCSAPVEAESAPLRIVTICIDSDGDWDAYIPVRGGWRLVGLGTSKEAAEIDAEADRLVTRRAKDDYACHRSQLWY